MGLIIALISGALMSIQGVFNTEVTKQTSIWVSSGWVQFSAFIACVIMWFFTGRNEVGGLFQVEPKYMLAGGIMGALITYTVIKSVGTLDSRTAIEVMGLFGVDKVGFEWKKAIGALVAIAGIIIFRW